MYPGGVYHILYSLLRISSSFLFSTCLFPLMGDSLATFSAKSHIQRVVLEFSEGQPEIQ
jgi:hypothetical protein